tara:strand:+ start:1938 stop:2387 length:450 start_codon:yes stop_codon:yes gene_type:complete
MLLSALFYISIFIATYFLTIGFYEYVKSLPMLNTYKSKGVLKDARITRHNVLGEEFSSDKYYIYFSYEVDGVRHGSSTIGPINNAASRNKMREVVESYSKKGEHEVDVYINKNDARTCYLMGEGDVTTSKIILGSIAAALGIIIHAVGV